LTWGVFPLSHHLPFNLVAVITERWLDSGVT
jgi:hypothetical protein